MRFFEGLSEGVYIGLIGPTETATLAANPHLATIFGWPIDTPTSDVRPFDRDRFVDEQARAQLVDRLTRDRAVSDYALRLRRWDGTAIWVEVTGRAEPLPSGSALRIEATLRDVTAKRDEEDQAIARRAAWAQNEKLASLGQTISSVAHELNNPLATVLACAERLALARVDDPVRRDLQSIHAAAERAYRIVRNLQATARKRHNTRTTVDLNSVVRETVSDLADTHRAAAVTVVEQLDGGLPEVFVDQGQIRQILVVLLNNAEQAMHEAHGGGTLWLRSWHDPARDAVLLEVRDSGPGISAELRAKVFEPFFTTKPAGKGTGLGLTMAYAIAQEHGGLISVGEAAEGGAAFLLELPVGGFGVRRLEALPRKVLPPVPKGTRALVIEDETALGDAVAAALADEGFRPDRAEDGAEALKKVSERHYDVIICDLKMPKVDGMSFFREVSAKMPLIGRRLIFVTGDVAGTDAERFLEESGCRWIPKPFRLKELVQLARETLR